MLNDANEAWTGAVLSTKNARVLYESARSIYKKGNIGCACALMVLSAEEGSKALAIGQHITTPLSPERVIKLFRSHDLKHEGAANVSSIVHMALGVLRGRYKKGAPVHGECGILEEIAKWRAGADSLKKKGFYVDYVNGAWISPTAVSDSDFEMSKFQAETLLTLAEGFFLKGTLEELLSHMAK